ncbi:MAG: peptidoglycan-binding protein LysM [Deltaproteobacteria bacterium]|nr:peptidoglycan-binding protein LysM [Deltaproteobacteria bacterium]
MKRPRKSSRHFEAANPHSDLNVAYKDGVVELTAAGQRRSHGESGLDGRNVKGVSQVRADGVSAPPQQAQVEYDVIQKGLLLAIANATMDAKGHPRIFDANREVIKNADLIYPGRRSGFHRIERGPEPCRGLSKWAFS